MTKHLVFITLATVLLLVTTSSAFAISDKASQQGKDNATLGVQVSNVANTNNNGKSSENSSKNENRKENTSTDLLSNKSENGKNISESKKKSVNDLQIEDCDENSDWKNHGEYVSCVAHTKPGGQVVSAAARSNTGKKTSNGGELTPTLSPSVTQTITPTEIPSVTSSATSSASPMPIEENELNLESEVFLTDLQEMVNKLKMLVDNFINNLATA